MTIAAKSAAYSIAATIATVGIIAVLTLEAKATISAIAEAILVIGIIFLGEFAFVVAVNGGLI